MDAIELNKTSSSAASGLGGSVSYRRQPVGKQTQLLAGISHSLGSSDLSDFGFAATASNLRLSGRYAQGGTYDDGEGRSFVDLYGYLREFDYKLAEVAATGERNAFGYRTDFTYTENVLFPYLQMDERVNRVYAGSVSFRDHKLYLNHTSHLMDNRLRKSTSLMSTDATNSTIGLVGPNYELFYRRWYGDNIIAMPAMTIKNDLIPDARQLFASLFCNGTANNLIYWGRLGLTRFSIEEKERAAFYKPLYGDQSTDRVFASWGVGAAVQKQLTDRLSGVITFDAAGEPPTPQALYIAVQRPMGKAYWSGNPGLNEPIRLTLRGKLNYRKATLELSASHVWDYADMISASVGSQKYQTYANFDMRVVAANFHADWRYFSLATGYSVAERVSTETPLAEMPPFFATYMVKSPEIRQAQIYWRHTYNDAQTRVDKTLKESPTGSWHRFDLGVTYTWSPIRLTLEVENLFDELYAQHLSYLRDPFASGGRVYEPGRTVRLNLVLVSAGR
jgi:iron complex outermembrane receptor protein